MDVSVLEFEALDIPVPGRDAELLEVVGLTG